MPRLITFSDGFTSASTPTFGKQIEVGTARTASSSALTGSSFTTFSTANNPIVVITPLRTGKFKISVNPLVYNSGAGNAYTLRITNSVGSGTLVWSQESYADQDTANYVRQHSVWAIYTLTAGTAYTFVLEGKTSAGNLYLGNVYASNGVAMIAEELI